MRRKKKKEKYSINDQFVALTFKMIESDAYKRLTEAGLKTLVLFLKKVRTYHPVERYEYQFPFTFPEAKKNGISNSSFDRALTQLVELGFIDCTVKGGIRSDGKSYSYYRLSKRWKDYGTPSFQKRWRGYCEAVHGQ